MSADDHHVFGIREFELALLDPMYDEARPRSKPLCALLEQHGLMRVQPSSADT